MSLGVLRWSKEESALEILVDNSVAVEVVDGTEDGEDDSGSVVLGKHAPCKDVVKEIAASDKLKGEVVLCVGIKVLIEFDLGG